MTEVQLKGIKKEYQTVKVIESIDLQINSGELVVFVGPSGCGKSTLLRMIAGLEDISGGQIFIDNEEVNDIPPAKRGVAMVFQSYALYPHMSIFDNMAFSLKLAGLSKLEIQEQVQEAARILQITDLLDRYPKELSGGQRQRVAIGRAIVRNPKLFLFDEPLSNLDAALRSQTRIEIERLHNQLKATMIYVTHDQVEAMTLANKIVVLNKGNVEQFGSPNEIYHRPNNLFVAGFIGNTKMNFVKGKITDKNLVCDSALKPIPLKVKTMDTELTIGIRPEHLSVTSEKDASFKGTIDVVENLGEYCLLYVKLNDGNLITIKTDDGTDSGTHFANGMDIFLAFDHDNAHFFDSSGLRLTS